MVSTANLLSFLCLFHSSNFFFLFHEEMDDDLIYRLTSRFGSSSVGNCDVKNKLLLSASGFLEGLEEIR